MRNNLELVKSVKDNVDFSLLCLEGVAEGFDNLSRRKSVRLEDLGQILFCGFLFYVSGNVVIEDTKQLATNLSH